MNLNRIIGIICAKIGNLGSPAAPLIFLSCRTDHLTYKCEGRASGRRSTPKKGKTTHPRPSQQTTTVTMACALQSRPPPRSSKAQDFVNLDKQHNKTKNDAIEKKSKSAKGVTKGKGNDDEEEEVAKPKKRGRKKDGKRGRRSRGRISDPSGSNGDETANDGKKKRGRLSGEDEGRIEEYENPAGKIEREGAGGGRKRTYGQPRKINEKEEEENVDRRNGNGQRVTVLDKGEANKKPAAGGGKERTTPVDQHIWLEKRLQTFSLERQKRDRYRVSHSDYRSIHLLTFAPSPSLTEVISISNPAQPSSASKREKGQATAQ